MSQGSPKVQPILVCMVWRGGERFARCIESIQRSRKYFSRVILSITGPIDGDDMRRARALQEDDSSIEVICTGVELPTMKHQDFWITYLQTTQTRSDEWIYWLAYDDEVKQSGLAHIANDGSWPLTPGTAYFGPWALRHETPDQLWDGDRNEPLESWTSFPTEGPLTLPVEQWIGDQLIQPTYMQMSGSVNPFAAFESLKSSHPRKRGPMRIEMAIAAQPCTQYVAEFAEPVSIIYGRSNSDRASYGRAARLEDAHLLAVMTKRAMASPRHGPDFTRALTHALTKRKRASVEEWRVRGHVAP